MKILLSLIVSGALVVSGYSQTRNVLVGTNNAVVQPTNFWSADASNARTGLGLGTAATNPASAFQPSSATLSNLAVGGGASLTNLAASNIVGTLSIGQGGTGSTNAADARTALGLGTAATNPASAFQPSSVNLSNIAANNGGSLTNLQATSLVGTIPSSNISTVNFSNLAGTLSIASGGTGATNAANARQNLGSTTVGDALFIATNAAAARTAIGALSTSGDAINLTNFPTLLLRTNGNGSGLTNLTSANITGTVALASNVTGTIAISNGGSGATTAGGARTNLGLGATWLTNTTASDFLSAVGLGSTNSVQFGLLTIGANIFVASTNQIDFGPPLFFGDRGTNAVFLFEEPSDTAIARTNLGLGWPALTNSNAGTGLVSVNTNGEVVSPINFWQSAPINTRVQNFTNVTVTETNNATNARNLFVFSLASTVSGVTNTIALPTNPASTFEGDVATVTHLATNTNAVTAVRALGGTNLITLNRLEETVQFIYRGGQWRLSENISHVEPIYFSGTNASANAAASRTNLGLGATATVAFYNGSFNFLNVSEDAYFTYAEFSGGSNSVELSASQINFQGAAAAATRTNLGLGATWLTNNNVTNFRTAIGLGRASTVAFERVQLAFDSNTNASLWLQDGGIIEGDGDLFIRAGALIFETALEFSTNSLAAVTRTNLGLGATNIVTFAGLTNNGDITIANTTATNGLLFIRRTNNEPFLGLANLIASNNTTISNETLFRVGVQEATNKAAQFGFRSTNTNGNGVAVFSVFGFNALMMVGPSDPAAGTNPIQATIYSINPTNRVMTLITTNTGAMQMHRPIEWDNTTNSAVTRTNLGLGLPALTNTSNVTFQQAIFTTNAAPTNPTTPNFGDHAAWMGVSIVTNGVTNVFKIPLYK